MKNILTFLSLLLTLTACTTHNDLFVEAESFSNKGGWSVDQQFTFEMGSLYLIAHGMGKAVEDATTTINIPSAGEWHIYARTYNWTSPW
ncbi:MAG: pyridine nucleotide-disulfide oxidoreductase, partial [Alistipes sp.]|nr:pyridine nucleotide-disulfide oxidoreductase [Alistipes sp.]